MKCDFCSSDDPAWIYPCSDIEYPKLGARSVGNWLACDICHNLIEDKHWRWLTERACATPSAQQLAQLVGPEIARRRIRWLHRSFRKRRHGPAQPLSSQPLSPPSPKV